MKRVFVKKVVISSSSSGSTGSNAVGPDYSSSSSAPEEVSRLGFYWMSYQTRMPGRKAISTKIDMKMIITANHHPIQKCTTEV